MQRGELRGFDLRDEDDGALPLLRSAEQVAVNTMLLRFAASRENAPVTSKDIQRFEQLSSVSRSRSAHAFGELRTRGLAGELCTAKFPALASLLRLFRDAYTLLVVLDSLDGRRIVKFGYDEPLPQPPAGDRLGFEPARFELDAPGAVHTASYHAQVVLPELVRARVARLEVPRRNAQPEPFDDDPDSDRPALHPTRALPIDSRPQIRVELSTERAAFFSAALTVGVLSTGLLAAGAVLAWARSLGRHDVVPPITIMLVASAVYPALVLTSDVRLLRQLLESGRLLLAVVALCSVTAAASLAFHAGYLDRGLTWSTCTAVAALATGGLAQGWFAAYATIVEQTSCLSDARPILSSWSVRTSSSPSCSAKELSI